MEKEQIQEDEELEKEKPEIDEGKLPPCTTAPSAEHTRAHDDSEPCDDARAG